MQVDGTATFVVVLRARFTGGGDVGVVLVGQVGCWGLYHLREDLLVGTLRLGNVVTL